MNTKYNEIERIFNRYSDKRGMFVEINEDDESTIICLKDVNESGPFILPYVKLVQLIANSDVEKIKIKYKRERTSKLNEVDEEKINEFLRICRKICEYERTSLVLLGFEDYIKI